MALHPACNAVENYLAATFPQSIIEEFEWTARRCWAFTVEVPKLFPKLTFRLAVSIPFLDETNTHEIEQRLYEWQVASRMRLTRGNQWVHVAQGGVTTGIPDPSAVNR